MVLGDILVVLYLDGIKLYNGGTGCYNGGIICYTGGVLIGKQIVVGGIRWYSRIWLIGTPKNEQKCPN